MNRHLEFYTDGAFSSKTEMGGWAAVCVEDGNVIDTQSGYEPYSTNNRMELTAFLSALENADTIETGNTKVTIYTDSAYIANCFKDKWYQTWMSNGWRTSNRMAVKNTDLWKAILKIHRESKNSITIVHVKGHTNNKYNNRADALATSWRGLE